MFVNEARKDYIDNLQDKLEVNNESRLEEQFEDTFIRGAICGYDKANEEAKEIINELLINGYEEFTRAKALNFLYPDKE